MLYHIILYFFWHLLHLCPTWLGWKRPWSFLPRWCGPIIRQRSFSRGFFVGWLKLIGGKWWKHLFCWVFCWVFRIQCGWNDFEITVLVVRFLWSLGGNWRCWCWHGGTPMPHCHATIDQCRLFPQTRVCKPLVISHGILRTKLSTCTSRCRSKNIQRTWMNMMFMLIRAVSESPGQ